MSKVEMVIEFLDGGKKRCLWDIVAGAICGQCSSPEDCDACDGSGLIAEIENQIAATSLEFMKRQAREWVKHSVEKLER